MDKQASIARTLTDSLADVESLLSSAHAIAMEQRRALIENNTSAVDKCSRNMEDVLRRILEADARAADTSAMLMAHAGIDENSASREDILRAAGPEYSPIVARRIAHISELSKTLKDANSTNAVLLTNGLDVVSNCIRIVAGEREAITYSSAGGANSVANSTLGLNMVA